MGVVVELSRSIAGVAASYEWSAMTDANGQARIEVTSSGYYQARVVQNGSELGHRSSIPLNVGAVVELDLTIAGMVPSANPRDLTRAYVEAGIARYERDGRDATVAYYNSEESIAEGEQIMMILQAGDQTLLAFFRFPQFIGDNTFTAPDTPLGRPVSQATQEGHWFESLGVNPATGQEEPRLNLAVLHDGLIFVSGYFIVREDLADFTQYYVQKAIAFYDREGLAATIEYYDSRESVDGQFYLFFIDENDIYLAHPIFPALKRHGHQGRGGV